jgi:hypothetical protein
VEMDCGAEEWDGGKENVGYKVSSKGWRLKVRVLVLDPRATARLPVRAKVSGFIVPDDAGGIMPSKGSVERLNEGR